MAPIGLYDVVMLVCSRRWRLVPITESGSSALIAIGRSCFETNTPKTAEPVSKMTVNFCLGVPTPTSMKYCVPFLLKIGIWSTCVRRSVCSAGNIVSSPRSSCSFVMGAWCSSNDPSSASFTGAYLRFSGAIPMMGRSRCVMSNSTMNERKNTSPMSRPCIPGGDGCTHVWLVRARNQEEKGTCHCLPPISTQNDLPSSQRLVKSLKGTLLSLPPSVSPGITRHEVPESMIEGRYGSSAASSNLSSWSDSPNECPKRSDVTPTMKSFSDKHGVYHISPTVVLGSYPPSCTSASVSVEKKENLRVKSRALDILFSMSVMAKRTGVGSSRPS
mmetsp:Transcript_68515/g.142836  ORF Transcript_68515/g.142836 Transcript_68515/m.142836 type:complete len:330 (+) Transcript_68515:233-1222(+)